jgi:transposase-like protein
MNILSKEKQATVVSLLAEGSSIRSAERLTGINQNTIMSLGKRVGKYSEASRVTGKV